MSRKISIMSKPRIAPNLRWRVDGENDQIVIVHKDDFALPRILNPVAAKIFHLCDGNNTMEAIAEKVAGEFEIADFSILLSEVSECARLFVEKGILEE